MEGARLVTVAGVGVIVAVFGWATYYLLSQPGGTETDDQRDVRWTRNGLTVFVAWGLTAMVSYSLLGTTWGDCLRLLGTCLAIAGSALVSGCLLGFLFGVPRALQEPVPRSTDAREEDAAKKTRAYGQNTNLEQVSDWLTKIIVGLGLTQLHRVQEKLHVLGTNLAPALGAPSLEVRYAFGLALVIHFFVSGFLFGYLLTRLYLTGALERAQRAVDKEKQEVRQQALQQGVGKDPVLSRSVESPADDPHKGKFGNHSRNAARALTARVLPVPWHPEWCRVHLELRSLPGAARLSEPVRFYLHPTFAQPVQDVLPFEGVAELEVIAYGAFTVGVEADQGRTRLELDLASAEVQAPEDFKRR